MYACRERHETDSQDLLGNSGGSTHENAVREKPFFPAGKGQTLDEAVLNIQSMLALQRRRTHKRLCSRRFHEG